MFVDISCLSYTILRVYRNLSPTSKTAATPGMHSFQDNLNIDQSNSYYFKTLYLRKKQYEILFKNCWIAWAWSGI